MNSATVIINKAGVATKYDVEFKIDSRGTPDSFWEPGDPAEITIKSITGPDGVEHMFDTEMYELCEQGIIEDIHEGHYDDMDWID